VLYGKVDRIQLYCYMYKDIERERESEKAVIGGKLLQMVAGKGWENSLKQMTKSDEGECVVSFMF
jgi:hypothetical protein